MDEESSNLLNKLDALEKTIHSIKQVLDEIKNLVQENGDLKTPFQKDTAKLLIDENDPNRIILVAQYVLRFQERTPKNFFHEVLSSLSTEDQYTALSQAVKTLLDQSTSADYEKFFRCMEESLELIINMIAEIKVEQAKQKIEPTIGKDTRSKQVELLPKRNIPILEDIAAGLGRIAENRIVDSLILDDHDCKGADFGIRVVGDSMKGLGIFPGDIALIRQQPKVETGEVAAIVITTPETDTLGVLKQFYRYEKQPDMRHWLLKSSNPVSEHLLVIPNGVNVKAIQALYDKEIQERRMRNKVRIYTNADLAIAGKYVGLVRKS